jgi:hypothetical protein
LRILFLYLFIYLFVCLFLLQVGEKPDDFGAVLYLLLNLSRHAEICLDAVSQVQSLHFYSFDLPCFNTLQCHVKGIPSPVG